MPASTEQRTRTITWQDPAATAASAHALPGLEFLHRLTSGLVPLPPVVELLGLRATYAMPGRVVFEYDAREEHYGSLGAVHGGILTAVLDTAMSAAAHTTLDAGVGFATVEQHTSFLRPVTLGVGVLRAEGIAIHSGSRLATAEAKLVDEAGTLYANGSSTSLVLVHEHDAPLAA